MDAYGLSANIIEVTKKAAFFLYEKKAA
jgi:hypothetical protein